MLIKVKVFLACLFLLGTVIVSNASCLWNEDAGDCKEKGTMYCWAK